MCHYQNILPLPDQNHNPKMADTSLQPYQATCHCGAVRLTFDYGDLHTSRVLSCNCSICVRNGYILIYPQSSSVKIEQGESELSEYRWAAKDKPHRFCKHCGSSMLIDIGQSSMESLQGLTAINLRMVPGIEEVLPGLELAYVDGKKYA